MVWWSDRIVLLTERGISVFDPKMFPSRPLEEMAFEYEEGVRLVKAPPYLFICGSGKYAGLKWEEGSWKRIL